jgi:GcrA cell cycle regulator
MSWTDERVEMLRTMWSEGKSASQIAKELGGVTRNAVIGKVHRLGLSNRVGGDHPSEQSEAGGEAALQGPAEQAQSAPSDASPEKPDPRLHPVESSMPARDTGETTSGAAPEALARPQPVAPVQPPVIRPARPGGNGQPLPPQPVGNEMSEETLANLAEAAKKAKRLTLMQLSERTCKWPVGDPATDDFWFCGLPSAPGKPYCETHVSVAFQPMSSRRDRRSSGSK